MHFPMILRFKKKSFRLILSEFCTCAHTVGRSFRTPVDTLQYWPFQEHDFFISEQITEMNSLLIRIDENRFKEYTNHI